MGRSEVNMDILWRPACGRVWAYGCSDQTVDDDVSLAARIFGDEAVHEVQELDTPATPVMTGLDQTGGDLQRGEQRRPAMALIVMSETGQRLAVGQPRAGSRTNFSTVNRLNQSSIDIAEKIPVWGMPPAPENFVGMTKDPVLAIWRAMKPLAEVGSRIDAPYILKIVMAAETILFGLVRALARRLDGSGSTLHVDKPTPS